MRTKTLALLAAIALAGITASQAQVFSVNAVGYVNKTVPAKGYALISNPLNAPTNTIEALLTGQLADNSTVYLWNTTTKQFEITTYLGAADGWDGAASTKVVKPGDGFFVHNTGAADQKITFVGEVPQGTLSTPLKAGFQIVSSQVPQAGTVEELGYKAAAGDVIYQWDAKAQQYTIFTFLGAADGWDPGLKTLDVGDAIFLSKTVAGSWDRTFTVQ